MLILFAADIHITPPHLGAYLKLVRKLQPEVAIIGGDLIPNLVIENRDEIVSRQRRYLEQVFVPAFKPFAGGTTKFYLDMGNDDFLCNRDVLEAADGELFHLIHGRKYDLADDLSIVGYMAIPFTPFHFKDWERADRAVEPTPDDQPWSDTGYCSTRDGMQKVTVSPEAKPTIEADLEKLSSLVDRSFLFISHCPPYGTALDCLQSGRNVGSKAIRRFIEQWAKAGKILASFHGHIHESPEVSGKTEDEILGVTCYNPGQRIKSLQYCLHVC